MEYPALTGAHVHLVPLSHDHVNALCEVGLDPELWRWVPTNVENVDGMRAFVTEALAERDAGRAIPFAQIDATTNRVVGTTRLANIDRTHRRAEIGWTWIGRPWQRTAINTEAKLLLFTYAFGTMGCKRVELKTDALNSQSRTAIARLGAKATPFSPTNEGRLSRAVGAVRERRVLPCANAHDAACTS